MILNLIVHSNDKRKDQLPYVIAMLGNEYDWLYNELGNATYDIEEKKVKVCQLDDVFIKNLLYKTEVEQPIGNYEGSIEYCIDEINKGLDEYECVYLYLSSATYTLCDHICSKGILLIKTGTGLFNAQVLTKDTGDFEKIVCSKEDLKQVLEEEVKITNTVYMEYYKRNTAIEELNEVNTIASVQKLLRAIKESVAQNTENSNALFSEEEKTNIELAIYYLTRKITQLAEKEGIDFSEERIMLDELLIKFTKETTLVKKEVQTQLINISTKLLERIYSREGRKVEVKLPFHEPELRAYLGDAYCYTILGNEIVHSPWIYDKYVDIEYNSINEQIKYAYYDYYDMLPNEGPLIKKYHIEPMPVKDYFGITQIVKKTIDRGEYFVCFWNEYAAINYMLHIDNDEIFYHGCMVYGYNDAKKVFYMAGYFRNKYIHYELPYEVFIKGAILGEHLKHCYTYRSYRVNESFKPVYSNEKIIEKVETYLEKQYDENDSAVSYNICAEREYIKKLQEQKEAGSEFHLQSIYCIAEQKRVMLERIKYLSGLGWKADQYIQLYEELTNEYENLQNMTIKYNAIKRASLADRLIHTLTDLIDREEKLLGEITQSLKDWNYKE